MHAGSSSTSIDSTSSSSPAATCTSAPPQRRAAEHGQLDLPLARAGRALQPRRDQLLLEHGALAEPVAGDDAPVEVERVRHDLAQVPDAQLDRASRAARPRAAAPTRAPRRRSPARASTEYASSVRSAAICSITTSSARSTASSTSGLSPTARSSIGPGSHATTTTLPEKLPDGDDEAQHGLRVHPVRGDHLAVLDRARVVRRVGLDHVQLAGLAALARDVDQHERVVAAHDLVGEVEPARAEVHHRHARRQLAPLEPLRGLRAEAVVLHPRVADPGDEDLLLEVRAHGTPPRRDGRTGSAGCRA